MEKLNAVVLAEDIDLRIHVKNHISGDDIIISGYSEFNAAGKLKTESLFPDIVICAVRGPVEERVFSFVQQMLINVRNCVAVLVNDRIDVNLVNKAAQFGIKAVLSFDINADSFTTELARVYELEQQRRTDTNEAKKVRSRVIAFFGGKGGTGKTTMSVNTATQLAKMGKRVMLVDLDLQFGDVSLALDLSPKDTIVELVQDRNGITIENINSFSVMHNTGLSVLSAPKSPEYAEYVKGEDVEKIIDTMRPYFEYIVIDLPPTFNDTSVAAIENSDEVYLVYNMEILSLKNAKTCVNILDQLHQRDKLRLVITKNTKGLINLKDFEKMLVMPVFSVISMDSKLATASLNKGTPIMIAQPKSEIAQEYRDFVERVLETRSAVTLLSEHQRKKEKKREVKAEAKAAKGGSKKSEKRKGEKENRAAAIEKKYSGKEIVAASVNDK